MKEEGNGEFSVSTTQCARLETFSTIARFNLSKILDLKPALTYLEESKRVCQVIKDVVFCFGGEVNLPLKPQKIEKGRAGKGLRGRRGKERRWHAGNRETE